MAIPSALEDEWAIRKLVDRYCDAVGRRDADDWIATWAPDASWELLGNKLEGHDAILGFLNGALGMLRFVMQISSNPVIEIDGDRARGRWTIQEWSESEAMGRLLLVFFYDDEYVRGEDGWLFASRRMELLYQGPPDLSGKSFLPGSGP